MCGRYAFGMAIDHIPRVLNDSVIHGLEELLSDTHHLTFETTGCIDGRSCTVQVNVLDHDYSPSYNIPPTSKGVIIYLDQTAKYDFQYNIETLSFGLLPEWAKKHDSLPVKRVNSLSPEYSREIQRQQARHFNCRKETLAQDKSVWDLPLKRNRCVVPIQGYFEWLDSRHGKTPYFIYLKTSPVLYLAGLFSHNTNYNDTEMVDGKYFSSFSIVTGPSAGEGTNDLLWLHSRKPIFIEPNSEAWFEWLRNEPIDKETLIGDCLKSTKNPVYGSLSWHTVNKNVGNPANKGVEVTEETKIKQTSITLFFASKKRSAKEMNQEDVKGPAKEVKQEDVKKPAQEMKQEDVKRSVEETKDEDTRRSAEECSDKKYPEKRIKFEVVGSEAAYKREEESDGSDS